MADGLQRLALDLRDFLARTHRATNIVGPQPLSDDWRSWELWFTHRGVDRHYIYHVQREDPVATMYQALRAETTGELMVRIPNERTAGVLANEIYYPPHG